MSNKLNLIVDVKGVVQGVGFRPFVYKLAHRYDLKGYVCNTGAGVQLHIEGEQERINAFLETLPAEAPCLARIDLLESYEGDYQGYEGFEIRPSQDNGGMGAVISPDIALCNNCLDEMQDPLNRRYRYPFINCTDCGPRYTIMQIPPYDRVRTSMKHFPMCPECEAEYSDPDSRRYHAEAISCPQCGPSIRFFDPGGEKISGDPIALAVSMLKEGKIIALKGLGGFHLMCDATSDRAVSELRHRKHRKAKPLAVMFGSVEELEKYACVNEEEKKLITGALKPIVIVDAKEDTNLSSLVAPHIGRIGVFLPYTPLHNLLFESIDFPLIATSANLSEEPIAVHVHEVVKKLGSIVDGILDHDRPIINGLDDSVVQVADGKTVVLRMGRGYAPYSIYLEKPFSEPIIALGAQQKSAVALGVETSLLLGGHIGDLGSIEADECFIRNIHTLKRFYNAPFSSAIHDLHPFYTSTAYARESFKKHVSVQHHYAHILACMAEHGVSETVLGFAYDGTGYGEDGTLWGGEVILADVHAYQRVGWLKPFVLLGGDKAIKEPRRVALALLFESYSLEEVLGMNNPAVEAFLPHEIRQFHNMWAKKLNAPLSSSMGRLFDGVASLGGFIQSLEYEGQGGMIMEGYVDEHIVQPFSFTESEGILDVTEMIRQIVALASHPDAKRLIASRFIVTVGAMMEHFADKYPHLPVVVGGGVFQNRSLMRLLYRQFGKRKFYAQQRTAINDGSIALGQLYHALFAKQEESL